MLELAGGSMIRGSARFLFGLAHGSVICALQNLQWLHLPKMENSKLVPTILYLECLSLPFIPFSHFTIQLFLLYIKTRLSHILWVTK